MRKVNKYVYLYILQGHYPAHGYEDLTAEETYREIRQRRKEYRENEPRTPLRVIKRREPNPAVQVAAELAKLAERRRSAAVVQA